VNCMMPAGRGGVTLDARPPIMEKTTAGVIVVSPATTIVGIKAAGSLRAAAASEEGD